MLKIFGHPMSTCTRKVLMTCAENETPYDLSLVDFAKGEHKQSPHLGRQPFGQIPAIDDDGFAMYESRAICRYLNDKTSGKLVPTDAKAKALMEQWISVETSNFTPHAMKFIYHHILGRKQDDAVLESAHKSLETALGTMDAHLATHAYFAGDDLSLADISFMPYVEYGMGTPLKELFAKYPNVMTWWTKVSARPAWQKTTGRAN